LFLVAHNSGPAAHSLSLAALRAIHLRSHRLQSQAPRPPVMSAAREAFYESDCQGRTSPAL